jgi:hypothetical protein
VYKPNQNGATTLIASTGMRIAAVCHCFRKDTGNMGWLYPKPMFFVSFRRPDFARHESIRIY